MIPHTQKPGVEKKTKSLAYLEVELLLEVLLDLLQPVQPVQASFPSGPSEASGNGPK